MSSRWPALLLLAFAGWCGTFHGGAGAIAAAAGVALVLVVVVRWAGGRDALGLGRGWWMPWLAVAWIGATAMVSPVPRAGWSAAVLGPAFLGLVGAVRVVGRSAAERRRLLGGLSAAAGLLALGALLDALVRREPAALPLGHHLLLGLVLVGLLPCALEAARSRGGLWWASPALVLGGSLATGSSLVGAASVVVLFCWATPQVRRAGGGSRSRGLEVSRSPRRLLVLGMVVVLLATVAVFFRFGLASGDVASARARAVYWQGGWRGSLERPWTGWGAGSTPWTVALHLRPRPGVNPPGELVGDLHSLPLQVLYELGWPGFLLLVALAVVWAWRGRKPRDSLARACRLGLLACLVVALGGVTLGTMVPWVLLAILVGATGDSERTADLARPGRSWPWTVYAVIAALALAPSLGARYAYDRARTTATAAGASVWLERAVRLDPTFPLYRARRAWLDRGPTGARDSLRAAEGAVGVADLWLAAGVLDGPPADRPEAVLLRGCNLDPLSAIPVFLAAEAAGSPRAALSRAVRALASEPVLAAATAWGRTLPPLSEAVENLVEIPGLEPGWRVAAGESLRDLPTGGPVVRLAREVDGDVATAMSLHLFRRLPWAADVASVPLWRDALERIDLPRASERPGTSPAVFGGCG